MAPHKAPSVVRAERAERRGGGGSRETKHLHTGGVGVGVLLLLLLLLLVLAVGASQASGRSFQLRGSRKGYGEMGGEEGSEEG